MKEIILSFLYLNSGKAADNWIEKMLTCRTVRYFPPLLSRLRPVYTGCWVSSCNTSGGRGQWTFKPRRWRWERVIKHISPNWFIVKFVFCFCNKRILLELYSNTDLLCFLFAWESICRNWHLNLNNLRPGFCMNLWINDDLLIMLWTLAPAAGEADTGTGQLSGSWLVIGQMWSSAGLWLAAETQESSPSHSPVSSVCRVTVMKLLMLLHLCESCDEADVTLREMQVLWSCEVKIKRML